MIILYIQKRLKFFLSLSKEIYFTQSQEEYHFKPIIKHKNLDNTSQIFIIKLLLINQ